MMEWSMGFRNLDNGERRGDGNAARSSRSPRCAQFQASPESLRSMGVADSGTGPDARSAIHHVRNWMPPKTGAPLRPHFRQHSHPIAFPPVRDAVACPRIRRKSLVTQGIINESV